MRFARVSLTRRATALGRKITLNNKKYPCEAVYRIYNCKDYPVVFLLKGFIDQTPAYNYIPQDYNGNNLEQREIRLKDSEWWANKIKSGEATLIDELPPDYQDTKGKLIASEWTMRAANSHYYVLDIEKRIEQHLNPVRQPQGVYFQK